MQCRLDQDWKGFYLLLFVVVVVVVGGQLVVDSVESIGNRKRCGTCERICLLDMAIASVMDGIMWEESESIFMCYLIYFPFYCVLTSSITSICFGWCSSSHLSPIIDSGLVDSSHSTIKLYLWMVEWGNTLSVFL